MERHGGRGRRPGRRKIATVRRDHSRAAVGGGARASVRRSFRGPAARRNWSTTQWTGLATSTFSHALAGRALTAPRGAGTRRSSHPLRSRAGVSRRWEERRSAGRDTARTARGASVWEKRGWQSGGTRRGWGVTARGGRHGAGGVAESTSALLKPVSGRISDRLGRRKLLVGLGYGGSVVAKSLCLVATTWPVLLPPRIGDRIGKGVRISPRDAHRRLDGTRVPGDRLRPPPGDGRGGRDRRGVDCGDRRVGAPG